jgi:hypothetical protein
MQREKKIHLFLLSIFVSSIGIAQHPDIKKTDSLKTLLYHSHGIQKIECLSALGEEYWWPPRIYPDSISGWANTIYNESSSLKYPKGLATAMMLFGVAEIYRKNFGTAEKYLQQALVMFEKITNDYGLGWTNVWLGQSFYFQNNFAAALSCYKRSLSHLDRVNEWDGKAKAWAWMGGTYENLGNYDSSYFYCSQSLQIRQKMSDHSCVAYAFTNMGHLYEVAGSNEDALDYYRMGFIYASTHRVDSYTTDWVYLESIGNIYRAMNAVDSSYYYLIRALQNDPNNKIKHISFAETLLMKNQYDSALQIFLPPVDHFRKQNDKWDLMRVLLDIAKAYNGKKQDRVALPYALESFAIAKKAGAKQYMLESYKLLPVLYNHLSRNDSAYYYTQLYTLLKDSIVNNQFLWKLSSYKKQADFKKQIEELAFLDKENKDKEKELRQKTLLQSILIACLLITSLVGFFIYKNLALKRRNEKLENLRGNAELQQHVTDLEMQALRAQMNPHFIFNCLSSINRFIFKNETEAASNYLTKFSRLIRMVLNNSKKPFINIDDEIEMLRLYLDLEKLRFKDAFEYNITFVNFFDTGNVFVPPLLLQPFAENAIWHGLMHKEGKGFLEIELGIDGKLLSCSITDNGIGRKRSAELKSKSAQKQKSMGLQITAERLALLNRNNDSRTFFRIEDVVDTHGMPAGTRVNLKINYKDLIEIDS